MRLIGMPDSPYACRVAVSMKLMGLAFGELERAAGYARPWLQGPSITTADVAVACAWRFGQLYNENEVPAGRYPGLVEFSARAEALTAFASTPLG